MPDTCVIIPTVRDFHIIRDYLKNARESSFDASRLHVLFVTEDFCDTGKMEKLLEEEGVSGEVFNAKKRDEWFRQNGVEKFSGLIPKRSHAETSFGLLWMWANGYEYGFFIDDDTLPVTKDFFGSHMKNLGFKGELETVSSDKSWVNVLYQSEGRLYPRGYPYSCMNEKVSVKKSTIKDVVASQGLWTNNPDLDAIRILIDGGLDGRGKTFLDENDFRDNFAAAPGNYLTISSMNLAFRKEIIPCFYQLPMDDNQWKIGRFDDIWSGLFLKKACDVLDKNVVNGFPLCRHNKAPRSTFKDLNAEVPALEINEYMWKIAAEAGDGSDYYEVYSAIINKLEKEKFSFINADFLGFMTGKMKMWLECVDKL